MKKHLVPITLLVCLIVVIGLLLFQYFGKGKDESKTFTYDFDDFSRKYECKVLVTNYGDKVFTKVSIDGPGILFRHIFLDFFTIMFYDKNGVDLDFEEIFEIDDFQRVKYKKRRISSFEGQLSTELDDDEKYIFEKLEYIVIEYHVSDNKYKKTEKIKQNFW